MYGITRQDAVPLKNVGGYESQVHTNKYTPVNRFLRLFLANVRFWLLGEVRTSTNSIRFGMDSGSWNVC